MAIAWFVFFAEGLLCLPLKRVIEASSSNANPFSFIIIAFHILVTLLAIHSSKKYNRQVRSVLLVAFIFRLVLMGWDVFGRGIWAFPDSVDAYTYMFSAQYAYYGMQAGRGGLYSAFVAKIIYGLFGLQPLVAQYFNILLSINTLMITIRILDKLDINSKTKYLATTIICLLPYMAIDNALFLRESIIQFLLASSLYEMVKWTKKPKKETIIFAFILSIIASAFHSGAIALAGGYSLWLVLYNREKMKIQVTYRTFFMTIILISAFFVVNHYMGDIVFSKFQSAESIEDVAQVARSRNVGGAAYSVGTSSSSAGSILFFTPIRMLYFLASPVPWLWRGATDIVSFFFSAFFYIYTVWIAFKVCKSEEIKNRGYIYLCLLIALMSAAIFAWGVSNSGAAMRHRDKFIAPFIVLFALCQDVMPKKRKRRV